MVRLTDQGLNAYRHGIFQKGEGWVQFRFNSINAFLNGYKLLNMQRKRFHFALTLPLVENISRSQRQKLSAAV